MLAALFFSVILGFHGISATGCSAKENGYDQSEKSADAPIPLLPLSFEWQKFYFTNTNSAATPLFSYDLSGLFSLEIVDLYCPGDTFSVAVGPLLIPPTLLPLNTTCAINESNPNVTLVNPAWSKTFFPLIGVLPGTLVKVIVSSSPFTAGAAAIRLVAL